MGEGIRWVGLDVHASRTAVAVVDAATGEVIKRTVRGRPAAVMELLKALERPVRAVSEAGPTGYGLARRSRPALEIAVCAPGMIPTAGAGSSSRVKTDARDALRLARLHHAGQLTLVTVPIVEQEQVRDLVRARGRPRRSGARPPPARQAAVAPRAVFPGPGARVDSRASRTGWHRCASTICPPRRPSRTICTPHDTLVSRRDRLDEHIEHVAASCSLAAEVARLRCLRGIDTLAAMGLCAETRGLARFQRPLQRSAFLGIVPS